MGRPLVVGNWKMFKGPAEAAAFCRELDGELAGLVDVDAAVCPPYVSLVAARDALAGSAVAIYAQNAHWEPSGAFTGEISAGMLAELGLAGAIVGHSERRQLFCDTDETVARRTRAVLDAGLRVIACVGESLEERESGSTAAVLTRQVSAIADAASGHGGALAIAYEPVWAIGTGRTATPELAQDAHALIRSLIDVPTILYGGSVKPDNAAELLAQPDVDGALVGGASLDAGSFASICSAATGT